MSALPEQISSEQESLLRRYLDQLMEANKRFNLTAVRKAEDAWDRHITECAGLLRDLPNSADLLDVGSGGGLPGMVLAICRPETKVTLLETTGKKARFLEEVASSLRLNNVTVVCDRAERAAAAGAPLRESFTTVTARAVAPLPTLLELTVPFLQPGGLLLAVKGQKADAEVRDAQAAFRLLNASLESTKATEAGTLLFIRKGGATSPKYPRENGEPKRKPL